MSLLCASATLEKQLMIFQQHNKSKGSQEVTQCHRENEINKLYV